MNIGLDLTLEEVNAILAGLLELPAKVSMDLIGKIRGQALQQITPEETEEGKATENGK